PGGCPGIFVPGHIPEWWIPYYRGVSAVPQPTSAGFPCQPGVNPRTRATAAGPLTPWPAAGTRQARYVLTGSTCQRPPCGSLHPLLLRRLDEAVAEGVGDDLGAVLEV